jgi:hypothetical protein
MTRNPSSRPSDPGGAYVVAVIRLRDPKALGVVDARADGRRARSSDDTVPGLSI